MRAPEITTMLWIAVLSSGAVDWAPESPSNPGRFSAEFRLGALIGDLAGASWPNPQKLTAFRQIR
jgi:hypothetical protein